MQMTLSFPAPTMSSGAKTTDPKGRYQTHACGLAAHRLVEQYRGLGERPDHLYPEDRHRSSI
jgi:hypothetical protein